MKKYLLMFCTLLLTALIIQPAAAQSLDNTSIIQASGQGGAYISGHFMLPAQGLIVNKDGTVYISETLFGQALNGALPSNDRSNGTVIFDQYDPETQAYTRLLSIQVNDQTVLINDGAISWQHTPYWQEHPAENALPNLMLPLREACQSLNVPVDYADGLIFIGTAGQPLTLPDDATIQAIKTNSAVFQERNPYTLVLNNGQLLLQEDDQLIWQSDFAGEGALVLSESDEGGTHLIVQEQQSDGTLLDRYILPEPDSLAYNYNKIERAGTAEQPLLIGTFINTAQSTTAGCYLIQPDGTVQTALFGSLIDSILIADDTIYYIQNWLFGGRSQLMTAPLAGGEPSDRLDRTDLRYHSLTLLDNGHLLISAYPMNADPSATNHGLQLLTLDPALEQYQQLTDHLWLENALIGQWIYGRSALDDGIYRFRTDGSQLELLAENASHFYGAAFDNSAAVYSDTAGCLWINDDQPIQLTNEPIEYGHYSTADHFYYALSGAHAGVYAFDRRTQQTICLFMGEIYDFAVTADDSVVILPAAGRLAYLYPNGTTTPISLPQ